MNYLENSDLRGHGNSGNKKAAAGKEPTAKMDIRFLSHAEIELAEKRAKVEEAEQARVAEKMKAQVRGGRR
jgi:hypothetical protein